jgi:hypothetical protein
MITVQNQDTQTLVLGGRKIGGILFNCVLFAKTAGTAISGVAVDMTRIRVKVIVTRRDGESRVIYNEQIRYAAVTDAFDKAAFGDVFAGLPAAQNVLLANGSGIVEKAVLPLFLNFKKVYDLQGGDKISVEINCTGFAGSTVDGTTSYIQVIGLDTEGVDAEDCEIMVYNIQAGKTSDSVELGSGVTDIHFLCFDKTSNLDADAPIVQIALNSHEHKSANITNELLIGLRSLRFEGTTANAARYQNHCLHEGEPLTDAKIDITLTGANVTASNCYIVYRRKPVSPASFTRATAQVATKSAAVLSSVGQHAAASVHAVTASKANAAILARKKI